MNLNPSDGHIMDYTTGWDDSYDLGSVGTTFRKDYLNKTIWSKPANNIAIIRHQKVCITTFLLAYVQQYSNTRFKNKDLFEADI